MGASVSSRLDGFRQRLIDRELIAGTFMKTPSPVVAEVLGLTSLDVIAIDSEHAPFGRTEADLCIGALRAADMPCLVRTADDSSTQIRNALDSGASGIVVPHVTTPEQARRIVRSCYFGDGGRGFAGSPRAAGYGTVSMSDHVERSAARTTVVVQIEDIPALDAVADIASVDGVDALFIGRADLAVAMRRSPMDADVIKTVEKICQAAIEAGTAVGMFTPDVAEIPRWRDLGSSLFLLGSDQGFLLSGAAALGQSIR